MRTKVYGYRVPFGHAALFLEAREFTAIVNGGEKLPQQQHCHPDQHNRSDYTENNRWDKHLRWAHRLLFGKHMPILVHHKGESTVVVIVEHANVIVLLLVHHLLHRGRRKQRTIRSAVLGQRVLALLVHLALHTVLVVVAPWIARRTRFTVLARVVAVRRVLALAFAAHAFAFARTHLAFARRYAALVRNQTIASDTLVGRIALAFAAIAVPVTGAQFVVATFAREVVAFAEGAGEHLFGVGARQAFALAAQAGAAAVAHERRTVVAALLVEVDVVVVLAAVE